MLRVIEPQRFVLETSALVQVSEPALIHIVWRRYFVWSSAVTPASGIFECMPPQLPRYSEPPLPNDLAEVSTLRIGCRCSSYPLGCATTGFDTRLRDFGPVDHEKTSSRRSYPS